MRCSGLPNEHHVQDTFVLLPTGTIDRGTPKHDAVGTVLSGSIAHLIRCSPAGEAACIPCPEEAGASSPVREGERGGDTVRKTCKYQLTPTPAQAPALEMVLSRCRTLYNVALEQRKTWWQRGQGIGATYYRQKAELPDLKAACPEYAEVNAQVLQDVILRVERAYQAFFRRLKAGEQPGYPRFQGRNRYNSFSYPQYGGGAVLDGGVLSLSKIGRIRIRLHRPLEGTPKTVTISREADGWYVCFSCAEVPVQPLPTTGQETGIDLGLEAFATLADGTRIANPRHYRKAEQAPSTAQRRVAH